MLATDAGPSERAGLTPFLKWAGGKRWFTSGHWDVFPKEFNRYVEPFLGSAAVFFHLRPESAVLSDLNAELVNTYKVVRNRRLKLESAIAVHARAHSEKYYYAVRKASLTCDVERAARFIYLNRTCWNGLYRVNQKGQFNVPIGTKDQVLLATDDFKALAKQLKGATLHAVDFEKTIDQAGTGDLLFVDPPYTVKHNLNGFVKYNDKIFSWADQIRLRDALVRANKRRVQIIMTNANHASVRDLYQGFEQFSLTRHSVLAGLSSARSVTEELLVTNLKLI